LGDQPAERQSSPVILAGVARAAAQGKGGLSSLLAQDAVLISDADGLLSAIYIIRNPDKLGHVRG
jgi:hypothetical protein